MDNTPQCFKPKALLGNAINQRDNLQFTNSPCGFHADATFNLLKDDWALTVIGCRGLRKSVGKTDYDGAFAQQFRPVAFALGSSENGEVYKMVFRLVCEHLQWLYDYPLNVAVLCQDHSVPCANAATDRWSIACAIILCWAHIKRTAVQNNKDKLIDRSLAEDANKHITCVHHSRSHKQFEKLLELMLKHWIEDLNESKFAKWFETEYGTGKWKNWHVTASGIPGFTPNNNLEESFNRDAKRGISIKTDTIGLYITETMPREISNWSKDLGTQAGPIVYTIPCSPNRHIIQKALAIVTNGVDEQLNQKVVCNYFRVTDTLKLTSAKNGKPAVVNTFNGYVVSDTETLYQNDMNYALTVERAKMYCLSLEGIFQPTWGFEDAINVCLKAHAVRMTASTATSRHPIEIQHAKDPVLGFRNDYVCDCKGYWHALICAHIVAAMHLNNDIDLHVMTRQIDYSCQKGRPSNSRMPIGVATHEAEDTTPTTVHHAAKFIGSRLSCNMADKEMRRYIGTVQSVFEGIDHLDQQSIIYRVCFPAQYTDEEPGDVIEEEFTYARMLQGISQYKEFERKKAAIKSKEGSIHFD